MPPRGLALLIALTGLIGLLVGIPAPTAAALQPNHYNIATYNSQGARWSDVRAIARDNDIVAVQEAGPDPSPYGMRFEQDHDHNGYTVREYTWGEWHVYWLSPTGTDGGRVNQAFVTRHEAHEVLVVLPAQPGARPALGVRFDNDVYYNIHAQASGTRNEAPRLVENIRNQAVGRNYAWTVMGDFNRDPNESMHDTARDLGAYVYHSGEATQQSGGELDYMISSRQMGNYRGVRQGGMGSDHYPVYFRNHMAAAGAVVDLISDSDHSKFIGFEGRSSANGTRVITDTYDANGSKWTLRSAPFSSANFYIVNNATGKCLDVGDPRSGGSLMEWDCGDRHSAVFSISGWPEEPGTWMIEHMNTHLCVDTMGSPTKYLALFKCTNRSPNQRFIPHFF